MGNPTTGQLKTAKGKESGGTSRAHEQVGYAYDQAWNLNYRTNNGLVQTFAVNGLNELTSISRTGNGVVAGAVVGTPTSVTVKDNANSAQSAAVYGDSTFARANVPFANGDNTFTAVAQEGSGRWATNVSTAWLPTSANLWYDLRGNLTNDGRRVFYYDDENQLTSVLVSNAWKSDFVYDGLMRRRIRKEYSWSAGAWLQTNEVRYIYDHRVVLQERFYATQPATAVPQQTVTYTRGHDLSGSFQEAGGIGGLLARSDSALQQPHAYYHADGNGNVTCLVDTNGVVVAQYSYDPYGGVLAMSGPLAYANLYRFSSKEAHLNSGLVYYLYRFYDPGLQRWVNRDPLGDAGSVAPIAALILPEFHVLSPEEMNNDPAPNSWVGINAGLYCSLKNVPVVLLDPFGLSCVGDAIEYKVGLGLGVGAKTRIGPVSLSLGLKYMVGMWGNLSGGVGAYVHGKATLLKASVGGHEVGLSKEYKLKIKDQDGRTTYSERSESVKWYKYSAVAAKDSGKVELSGTLLVVEAGLTVDFRELWECWKKGKW